MKIKTTKTTLLCEVNNSMCHNFYYLVQGQIYNDKGTNYKRFKFIVWFDVFDLLEFFEQDTYTKADLKEYVSELSYGCFFSSIKEYEDCKEFYDLCNESIYRYNNWIYKAY